MVDHQAQEQQPSGPQQQAQQHPDDEPAALSFFPFPPPYYKHFTTTNLERLKDLKENIGIGTPDDDAPLQLNSEQFLALPAELRCLIPPEPPTTHTPFRVFNRSTQIEDKPLGLKDWGYEQLYPSPPSPNANEPSRPNINNAQTVWTLDRAIYLKKMVRSVLLNFMELLDVVAKDAASEERDKKLQDIATIVANMHSLINEYRPHQARETLIIMMEEQLEKKRKEVEGVRKMKEKVEETLKEFKKDAPILERSGAADDAGVTPEKEKRLEGQRRMWKAIDEIVA